jgi:hypothetical protein
MAVQDLGVNLYGIRLSVLFQFTVDGNEYVLVYFSLFGYGIIAPAVIIFNLTDDTVGMVDTTGLDGGDPYQCCQMVDLLDNGHIVMINTAYYWEIDLATKAVVASHAVPANTGTWHCLCEGLTGHVIIGQGAGSHRYLDWVDQGGANYTSVEITAEGFDTYTGVTYPCSALSTDTDNYAYALLGHTVLAVNMRTLAQQKLDLPSADGLYMKVNGGDRILYVQASGAWYSVDGFDVTLYEGSPPGSQFHTQWNCGGGHTSDAWFVSEVIEVNLDNIYPNEDNEVSISYDKGEGTVTKTVGPVTPGALPAWLISEPDEFGTCICRAYDYGPEYSLDADNNFAFLGYCHVSGYGQAYDRNHGWFVIIGYDKKVFIFYVYQEFTDSPLVADHTITNPAMIVVDDEGLGLENDDDRFLFPCTNAITKELHFSIRSRWRIIWYNYDSRTYGQINFKNEYTLFDCDIIHLKVIRGGHYLAVSSSDQDVEGGDWIGRLRIIEVLGHKTIHTYTPDIANSDLGAICECDLGHVICISGNKDDGCLAWRINTYKIGAAAIVWGPVALTGNVFNLTSDGMQATHAEFSFFEIAPNGKVYFLSGSEIWSLDPTDGTNAIVDGLATPANCYGIRVRGNDLLAYGNYGGGAHVYLITGLF